jgi:anti-sigma B factor antagonist
VKRTDYCTPWVIEKNVILTELDIAGRRVGSALVISVAGELDMHTAPSLCPALERFLSEAACGLLVVDLGEVVFLGSSGLRALIDIRDRAADHGIGFRLVTAGNRIVSRPLEIMKVDQELVVYATIEDALRDSGASETPACPTTQAHDLSRSAGAKLLTPPTTAFG